MVKSGREIKKKKEKQTKIQRPVMSINVFLRMFAIGNEKVWWIEVQFLQQHGSRIHAAITKISSNRKINFHLNDEKIGDSKNSASPHQEEMRTHTTQREMI